MQQQYEWLGDAGELTGVFSFPPGTRGEEPVFVWLTPADAELAISQGLPIQAVATKISDAPASDESAAAAAER